MAGEAARGATLYVTLEPCAHQGKTPPCVEAIIQAGIVEVVVACGDPDPRVNGKGIALLKQAGIRVITGIGEAEAQRLNQGFFSRIQRNRPFVTLKTATSLDGFIATATGESQWITGEAARKHGHWLRSRQDAILTGIGTILADNPQLNCRAAGLEERSPVRVVLDRNKRMPQTATMLHDGGKDVWVLTDATLESALQNLAERGITRLLVEAGSILSGAFLVQGLVDALYWYRAPLIIGEGIPAFGGIAPAHLAELARWNIHEERAFGADRLTVYER
jgi:diaminohydroxyphosphoribosylaminopyrimidine deaminase/5-amino-6-(5-phosphoribosylamino)uracil reductase